MRFKMWKFQKEMINLFKNNRFVITKCPRQVGKTTTTVGYLLWATIFTDTQNVAVLANKGSLARDILAKYQLAYEDKQPVIGDNGLVYNDKKQPFVVVHQYDRIPFLKQRIEQLYGDSNANGSDTIFHHPV